MAKIRAAKIDDARAAADAPALVAAASTSELADAPQAGTLRDAMRRQRKVAISYEDGNGTSSDRIVWPIALVYFDTVRVLAAWCELRSGYRHFRVNRLRVAAVQEERYPGRRHMLFNRWREQDRDWRSMLTIPGTQAG